MAHSNITIIDSDICNLFNVTAAFTSLGCKVLVTRSPREISKADKLVLPGVGAFGPGMRSLSRYDLIEPICTFAKSGKPLLGICLGMQMLASVSEELGQWEGLDLIRGRIRMFQKPDEGGPLFKIPQIGWNLVHRPPAEKNSWHGTVLQDIGDRPYVYFVHSFVMEPEEKHHILGITTYGKDTFCSVVKKDNISGCQFHPERSGPVGMRILQNFLKEKGKVS